MRWVQDLATQIHYWTEFRKAMKDYTPHVDLKAKRFLPPVLAEWFAGLLNCLECCVVIRLNLKLMRLQVVCEWSY